MEINKDSRLSILIDPDAGDSLQVKGEATLNFTMDPSGKQSLTGRYEISEGIYQLSFYNIVKRKFVLKAGSITWNGDPLKADIDLTAVYQVITSPIDLMQDQLTNMDDQQRNTYRQPVALFG